jgi:hypothetical protein
MSGDEPPIHPTVTPTAITDTEHYGEDRTEHNHTTMQVPDVLQALYSGISSSIGSQYLPSSPHVVPSSESGFRYQVQVRQSSSDRSPVTKLTIRG